MGVETEDLGGEWEGHRGSWSGMLGNWRDIEKFGGIQREGQEGHVGIRVTWGI